MSFPIEKEGDVVDNEKKIIIENNKYSATEMARKLQLTQRTIQRYLKQLQEKQLTKRIGATRGGYWEITKK